jgi:hypothetical protein
VQNREPSRTGRYDWVRQARYNQDDESTVGKDQTVPYGTDSRLNLFQAINCLATIMKLGEVLIPWVVVIGTFGFLAAWLVVAIMERTGFSRYVWHLPLFFLALVVLLSSVLGMLFQP